MSKKISETKSEKQAAEKPPIELSDDQLDNVQGAAPVVILGEEQLGLADGTTDFVSDGPLPPTTSSGPAGGGSGGSSSTSSGPVGGFAVGRRS